MVCVFVAFEAVFCSCCNTHSLSIGFSEFLVNKTSTLLIGDAFKTSLFIQTGDLRPVLPRNLIAFWLLTSLETNRTWCLVKTTLAYCQELGILCPNSLNHIKMQLEGTSRSSFLLLLKTSNDGNSTFLICHWYTLSEDFLF